ncbi:MAG: hypothetical protein WC527_05200 [Candidatus Margulisiibacteriota bacterium]
MFRFTSARPVNIIQLVGLGKCISQRRLPERQREPLLRDMDNLRNAVPVREGRQRELLCDAHVHTRYSDGRLSARKIFKLAQRSGVGTVVLTDHRASRDLLGDIILAAGYGVDCTFGGIELSLFRKRTNLHFKLYFNPFDTDFLDEINMVLNRDCKTGADFDIPETLDKFMRLGCWSVLAHPTGSEHRGMKRQLISESITDLCQKKLLCGIEICDKYCDTDSQRYYSELAARFGLIEDGGSDFHNRREHILGRQKDGLPAAPYSTFEIVRRFLSAPLIEAAQRKLQEGDVWGSLSLFRQASVINPYDLSLYDLILDILFRD